MSVFNAKDTGTQRFDARIKLMRPAIEMARKKGMLCHPAGHCNGHDEYCDAYSRESGCMVSTTWLKWYRARLAAYGAEESTDFICSAKQSPWS